jgi:hypothetical protein
LATEFLDPLGVLGLDGYKSFGDHIPEKKGDPCAVFRSAGLAVTELTFPVWVAEFVEHGKNFAGYRNHHLLYGRRGKI